MTYLRALSTVSLVTLGAALFAAACGDSAKDPAASPDMRSDTTPGGNGNINTATGANNPAPGTAGGNAATGTNTEVGNGNVSLNTPGRDPSLPINLAESGAVACGGGGDFCIAPNPTCCIAGAMGMNTFSCAALPSDCPADTVSAAACASAVSCGTGQVCCRSNDADGNGTTASCAASCAASDVQLCNDDAECGADRVCNNNNQCGPAPCTATSCATGELCCRGQQGGGQGAAPACVAVATGGLCPVGRRQVCADASTCPTGDSCSPIGGGGGGQALVCTPPACTPTSCATGQTCCVGGQVGGNPTCSTPDPTTALCPNNSRTVCIADADCAAVPNTLCLLNPNGGGSLSCRVPPPPPAADAGADGG